MQITIDDKEIYDKLTRMESNVGMILEEIKDFKVCTTDHEARLRKLEREKKVSGVMDWTRKGGTGAGVMGLVGLLYLLLQKLGIGGF